VVAAQHHSLRAVCDKYLTMFLREFIYFDKDYKGEDDFSNDFVEDKRYDPDEDKDKLSLSDTRKTRLTLKQLNQMRKNYEAHMSELAMESELVQAQYATPVQPPA
jgi:hypothetical protein